MKRIALFLTTSLCPIAAWSMDCDGLSAEDLGLSEVTLTEAVSLPAGEDAPVAMCRIRGHMADRVGRDGNSYALSFELSLPDEWNGDYVHQFNGGNDGEVKPATGALSGTAGTSTTSPLARGFAVVSSDAGHDGKAFPDFGLAGGAAFGFDYEARRMYGYGAVAMLDPVARDAVEAYYGGDIAHSYGVGCSNGGRHAMVAAVRMPEAFDGLLIGAPGYELPKAAMQHAWDVQNTLKVTGDLKTAFSSEDLALVGNSIRAACDALDGAEDGWVADTQACQQAFDISTLQCSAESGNACLSEAQVKALSALHSTAEVNGEPLYSDFLWDAGVAGGNWRFWKLESPIPTWDNLPLIATMGAASLAEVFTVPPTKVEGTPSALEAYLKDMDIAAETSKIYATSEEFPQSPMQLMTPPGSDSPELTGFRAAGGRMIIFHGTADPVFSVKSTQRWYDALDANTGGADEFARFYPVAGMNHCAGGPGPDNFDLFAELVNWVEEDTAPEAVPATFREDNQDLPEATLAGASRPLCPAPKVAHFTGGDMMSADSFTCQ